MRVSTRQTKNGLTEVYPTFIIRNPSQHLMIRGGDFYAIWVEEKGLWSTSEQDAVDLIDRELDAYVKENASQLDGGYRVLHMWNADSSMVDKWHKYCQKQMRDSFHMLDEKLIFSNTPTRREDYASKRLPYPLEKGDTSAWDQMMSVLYAPTERHKIEWAIGSIVSGDSRKLQKFMVLYGAAGTGKSTVIGIIEQMFAGYTATFVSKDLGQSSNAFALEPFKKNPLVAIEHDGDLSRIEDNTRINSLVSHERMSVNEKFAKMYENNFKCFLFMGTNKPVKITDAKSGLLRRLIDVTPTGEKLENRVYLRLRKQIEFELGAIAQHCLEVYMANPNAYDEYIPTSMLSASNDFYNFVLDSWPVFCKENETTLKAAWAMYKTYCDEAKVAYPYSLRAFKEELKNYFHEYVEREQTPDGTRVRSRYRGFRVEKFGAENPAPSSAPQTQPPVLGLKEQPSLFDQRFADCPAQYATDAGTPGVKWENVKTTLKSLDTSRTHYVKIPENVIVIDFDIPGANGEKDFAKNLEEAAKWPPTYAEVSQSGKAIHLHYIYEGDVTRLSRLYAEHIEIKVFTGGSSLRRRRTLCNDRPIAALTQGLPLKEVRKTVDFNAVQSEKGLRSLIQRNLAKEIHPGTKPSIDFIFKILEDAHASGLSYDVSDMKNAVIGFAAGSTHHADECLKKVAWMKFKSDDRSPGGAADSQPMVFYDVEVFPNLFLVNWKLSGEGNPVVRMINPKPEEIENLMRYRLVGFNCRRYDNHILYARFMGYTNEQLYNLSQRIVSGGKRSDAFFGEAYNVSYTDVYDFASTSNRKSLKKFEIELGIHHQELGLPWDKPVPEELWPKVAEYCDNDVLATEAVFHHLSADWTARQILADLAGMTVNDTTNSLTTRIIFDRLKKPQSEFLYRDLSQPVQALMPEVEAFLKNACPDMMAQRHGEGESLLPYFPGYSYSRREKAATDDDSRRNFVSTYRGEEVGVGFRIKHVVLHVFILLFSFVGVGFVRFLFNRFFQNGIHDELLLVRHRIEDIADSLVVFIVLVIILVIVLVIFLSGRVRMNKAGFDRFAGIKDTLLAVFFDRSVAVNNGGVDHGSRVCAGEYETYFANKTVDYILALFTKLVRVDRQSANIAMIDERFRVFTAFRVVEEAIGIHALIPIFQKSVSENRGRFIVSVSPYKRYLETVAFCEGVLHDRAAVTATHIISRRPAAEVIVFSHFDLYPPPALQLE